MVQMHNQAKSSVTSSLEKVQAAKDKKEQELTAAHQALEETNRKLQVCILPPNSASYCWHCCWVLLFMSLLQLQPAVWLWQRAY